MIPMSRDVAMLIGDFAESVENRSLLYEKYSLAKVWGQESGRKLDDAGRWSVLRIVTRGSDLLKADANRRERNASGRNVQPQKADRLRREAQLARKLAQIARPDARLAEAAAANARQFLNDLKRAFVGRVTTFEATLAGRLLVNLAGGVVENAGICLDRCFGLPFLPGSAVKGIARAQALWEIRQAPAADKERLLRAAMLLLGFGGRDITGDFAWAAGEGRIAQEVAESICGTEFKGTASFLPAYPTTAPKLVVDMVNPHYPDYYRGGRQRATDDENPVPNYFPAVEAGSAFGFAVLLNRLPEMGGLDAKTLLEQCKAWLERAITSKGAGAKTAAGYGWFVLGRPVLREQEPPSRPTSLPGPDPRLPDPLIEKWKGKLASSGNFPAVLPELVGIEDPERLKRVFEAVFPANELRNLLKRNPYWQSFTSRPQGAAILKRLGITLT
jgi:CRISPR type III-B/RAMP module RAMP protein Cmr6